MKKNTYWTLLAATLLATTVSAQDRVPVFLRDVPIDGFVDEEMQGRIDSVKDLRSRLKARKNITLVDAESEAQVVVEVLGRGLEATGQARTTARRGIFGQTTATTTEQQQTILRAKLIVGSYETEILGGSGGGGVATWRAAALDTAEKVEEWIKRNRSKLAQ